MEASPIYSRPREKYIYFYATNQCQLRCRHCYVGNERLNEADRFDLDKLHYYLQYFRAQGGHDRLYILGGEPTLHPQLPEFVDLAVGLNYTVCITSNGDFPDELFSKLPPNKVSSFNFSLESADREVHTRLRGRRDNFDKVVAKIKRANELGYRSRVSCTVSKTNVGNVLDLIPFVSELGAATLSFHNLGYMGNAKSLLQPLDPNEWMQFCQRIEDYPPEPSLTVYYPPSFVPIAEQSFWAHERGYPGCPAKSLDRPHVYPDGTVYSCPLLMDGEQYFAKFEDDQLKLNPSDKNELNALLSVNENCLGCSANQTCGGGCPAYERLDKPPGSSLDCDRVTTPMCMLWTTYAWGARPDEITHRYR